MSNYENTAKCTTYGYNGTYGKLLFLNIRHAAIEHLLTESRCKVWLQPLYR